MEKPINYIYFRTYHDTFQQTYAYVPMEKNEEGKFDLYLIASVKLNPDDFMNNSKVKAREFATAKLQKYLHIYETAKLEVKPKIIEQMKGKGIYFVNYKQLMKLKEKANKNSRAIDTIKSVANDLSYCIND